MHPLYVIISLRVDYSLPVSYGFTVNIFYKLCATLFGPRREKTCLQRFANNNGADQPAHSRSVISAFVIRCWESTISKLYSCEISIFYLVSVTEQTGLNMTVGNSRGQVFSR